MMTDERLAELEALADDASIPYEVLELAMPGEALLRMGMEQSFSTRQVQMRDLDAAFIAAARTAVSELIAEVRELQEHARGLVKAWCATIVAKDKAEADVVRLRRGLEKIRDAKSFFDECSRRDEELDAVVAVDEVAENLLEGRGWDEAER